MEFDFNVSLIKKECIENLPFDRIDPNSYGLHWKTKYRQVAKITVLCHFKSNDNIRVHSKGVDLDKSDGILLVNDYLKSAFKKDKDFGIPCKISIYINIYDKSIYKWEVNVNE